MAQDKDNKNPIATEEEQAAKAQPPPSTEKTQEYGGPKGPEPTRFGDWEKGGRCIDF